MKYNLSKATQSLKSSPLNPTAQPLSSAPHSLFLKSFCDSDALMGQLFIDILDDVRLFYDDFQATTDITFWFFI